ncbi:MFS transporter [Bacteroidota bacterium]
MLSMRETLKLPLFYFLLLGSFAGWQSLYNVHLDAIGYTSVQIGVLNAIFISTSAIVVPFWGMIADKFGNNRIFFLLTSVTGLMVFLIGKTNEFHWMLVFIAVISLFHQPAGAVIDGMNMGFVRSNPRYSYGQFRLWASVGWAIISLIVGYLAVNNTYVIFNISAILFFLLSLINLLTLPSKPVTGRSLVTFRSFSVFFRNRQLLVFLALICFYGMAIAPLHQFINLYYKDIGAGNTFIGIVFFVQAAFEAPTFLLGVWLARKRKAESIILLSMSVSALRMLIYGFIDVPQLAMVLSLFHGITIAFFLIGVVEYVQQRTPDHLRTTGQSLIWAFHFGAGVTLGNLLLGYLRDYIGMMKAMHVHFGLAALVVVITAVFFRRR